MRLWTIHPRYLDSRGLVAAWREGLLAQKVLSGQTRGYRHHPQLERFKSHPRPMEMIGGYLRPLYDEALVRGYRFDGTRVQEPQLCTGVEETRGQLLFEWRHLLEKLAVRSPAVYRQWQGLARPDPHPLFTIVAGPKQEWERS
jgi:hypothetical protein